jgi:hypothetical protein
LLGIVNPFVDSFLRFFVFDVDERSQRIAVGFVGMLIPRSGIRVIVGSICRVRSILLAFFLVALKMLNIKGTLLKIGTLLGKGIVIKGKYATTSEIGCARSSSSHHGTWD